MEREELRAGQSITVGDITLLPVLRISVSCRKSNQGIIGFGLKNLVGIVVVSPGLTRAMNVDGEEVPVEQYAEQVPEVKKLLQST